MRVVFLPLGETRLELLEPLNAQSAIARFLDKRGEGIHHICVRVDRIEETVADGRSRHLHIGCGGDR